jgi:hypothetical protein
VQKLIAGPSVYICDECVELCVDIIRDGILWKVMSRLRASEENGSDAYQAALEHVRSTSAGEVASYVEQSKVGVLHNQHLIDQRLAHGKVPQEHDALASPTFAHLNTMSNEELVTLQKRTQRELTHYENALRIGTTVLEERRSWFIKLWRHARSPGTNATSRDVRSSVVHEGEAGINRRVRLG